MLSFIIYNIYVTKNTVEVWRFLTTGFIKCKIALLDLFHRLNYNILKLQHFWNWILLLTLGEMEEEGSKQASDDHFLNVIL
jgi:hypothetical protein